MSYISLSLSKKLVTIINEKKKKKEENGDFTQLSMTNVCVSIIINEK